jgi:DNA-binding transcriptional ArsR family regulator
VDEETLRTLKALADPARIRILGLVADRPWSMAELTGAVRRGRAPLRPAAVARHVDHLRAVGLVRDVETPAGPAIGLQVERLGEIGRALDALDPVAAATAPPIVDAAGRPLPPDDAKTLRAFVAGDHLVSIPVHPRKRDAILRWLLERCFAEDRDYPEKEVNQRLALHHPDVASLRRYLVDEGYLSRAAGIYRRTAPPDDGDRLADPAVAATGSAAAPGDPPSRS